MHAYTLLFAIIIWVWGVYRLQSVGWLIAYLLTGLVLQAQVRLAPSSAPSSARRSVSRSQAAAGAKTAIRSLAYTLPLVILFTLVSALFAGSSASGGVVLWRGPHVPALGTLSLTTTSIWRGLFGALRIWALLFGIAALTRRIRSDDVTVWLGRAFARAGLTLSMMMTFLPMMQRERQRLSEFVWLRGGLGTHSPWSIRLRATAFVAQAMLANGLERSWSLAESMYVRGYSAGGRTLYQTRGWQVADTLFTILCLVAIALSIIGQSWMAMDGTLHLFAAAASEVCSSLILCIILWLGGRTRGAGLNR